MTTVVILDLALCGTSMLSGLVHRLGIPMVRANYQTHESRVEDADVLAALSSEDRFKALCRERQGTDWGFKHPGAWRFEWMPQYLENPVYLAIYKDVVSVTWRKFEEINGTALLSTLAKMRRSVMGIESRGLPCHYLSYYWATQEPLVFTRRLAHIIGTGYDRAEQAAEWIVPGGYNDG